MTIAALSRRTGVAVINSLRAVGLTMAEICELITDYLHNPTEPIGPRLAQLLGTAP
jgi:hypothetical protein